MNDPIRTSGGSVMPDSSASFEVVHERLRLRLAWETYALTGDLRIARSATREALVVSAHHWRTVRALPDPAAWIRPHAWARARHRLWLRKSLGQSLGQSLGLRRPAPAEGRAGTVLAALDTLPADQRRALVLAHVSAVDPAEAATVLGGTPERYQALLQEAETSYAAALRQHDAPLAADGVDASLALLRPAADAVPVPPAQVLFRHGTERRRAKLFATALSVAAVALLGGVFVTGGANAPALPRLPGAPATHRVARPVSPDMLLGSGDLAPLTPAADWRIASTDDGRGGTQSECQRSRDADPRGLGTAVRRFTATPVADQDQQHQQGARSATEAVEVSASPGAAEQAYRTTLEWYADCAAPGMRIERAWKITGLGEQAGVLQLSGPANASTLVGLARTGSLTVSTLHTARATPAARPGQLMQVLTSALRELCRADASGPCRFSPALSGTTLPRTGEEPGTLGVADLPSLPQLGKPWAGSQPATAQPNPAATVCDPADLVAAGAKDSRSRTYLVPGAKVPTRFGITQTWGSFGDGPAARRFTARLVRAMQQCPKKSLGATVSHQVVHPPTSAPVGQAEESAVWRLDSQINAKKETVGFWTGVVRVGRVVTQVTFAPVPGADVDQATFEELLQRAAVRLHELPQLAGSTARSGNPG